MPIVVEVPNRGSIEFADGTSDADIDAIVSKEFPPTQEDSYQKVLGYEQGASDETPSKDEYLAYLQAKKTKPLLGERPMATLGEAALETGKMLATLPYRAGEAIGDVIMPQLTQEGLTPVDVAVATGAEVAARSELGARRLSGGLQETLLSEIDNLAQRFGQTLRSDDDKYQAFLGLADVKRKLAKAQSGEQLASQEFLQAYNLPQEAISQAGLEVGGFLAAPENIAFAGGGKLAGELLGGTARALPAISGAAQRTGARIGTAARIPEVQAGRAVTAITGSETAGQAVERAIGTGTTGVAAAEALGLPVAGNIPIPGAGMAASAIGTAKAVGAGLETLGEAGAISGGEALSPIQRGLLGFGERIAAQEGASRTARAFGNIVARTGADVIVPKTASILVPALGAGAAGGLLAGMTGEEGDQIAAAIGSGFAFGGIESGIRMAAAKGVFDANRVRATATEDLNTRPNDVQFTYIEPTTKAEQTVTLKDRDARAQLYEQLDDKQLVKALSEIANAENAGVDVVFHKDGDPVPQDLQQVRYKGVALSTDSVKSGRPTILVNVDKAVPETIPHEILHARITADMVARIGSQIIEGNIDKAQFKSFANKYAQAMLASGAPAKAKAIFNQVKSAFDPKLQRAQRIDALRYMADEFAAYYTQEFLAGKDPKTVLPGRLPSFFEAAFNSAKEAVSDKFTQKALQSGFDPIAKTFYGPDGKRIKIPWMDDAINQLIIKRKGFEPSEQRLDMRKLTPIQQAALVMSRGFEDLYILNPDGSIGRPKTGQELKLQDIDIAQRSIKLLDSLPAADRGTVTGLDAKGNTIIQGRLSLAEADALARSGIFSASTSRYITEIARAIQDGSLLFGNYWKVYGPKGKPGVYGENQKLFLPYGISLNSAGGVLVKLVDFGRVQARMDAALQKQAYKNLFRSYDQAMATLRDVYLKNLADPNGKPSAEALGGGVEGARKRNFFNEVMGAVPKKGDVMINEPTAGYTASRKGGSVYEDLRIERVQNVEQTGMKIPWSGDMGEQSSYRRTQLNFQPAETIGDKSVESDANAGFRILSSRGKFRLYSPDGDLLGIYDSAGQAKLKAEKTYATQTRLQPENDQLQYPARDEVGQTSEAGGGDRPVSSTQGRDEGRQALRQVRQEGDVTERFDTLVRSAPEARFMPIESQPENAPVSGRLSDGQKQSIDEISAYYASQTPQRVEMLRNDAVDSLASRLVNKGIPVQEANKIALKTFQKARKGVSGALQVISGLGLSDLSRMAGTGKPTVERRSHINPNWMTSAFEAFATDEGLALMKAQQVATQLSKADQAKVAAGQDVEAAKASGVRQSSMQQGMEFVRGEMNADKKAFGSSLREDPNSPPRVYASVVEGQKFGSQGNYNVFFEWKTETPMVVTSHHHYGVANGVTGIHAQGNVGDKNARSFGNPSAEQYDTLPSGKKILNTHLLVGNAGVPDVRAHQLTVSIPESSLSNVRKIYKERGAAGVEAELNKIAVSQMVGSASQGKTFSYTTKEGIPPMVAIQRNRTEAYVLNPDLANVASVTIVSNSPKEVSLIKKNLEKAFQNNGTSLPKVKVVSAESGPSKNVGRKAITDEYFKLTGEQRFMPSDTDYLAAVQAGDTQAAQQMVDQAAKAAGYTIGPVYHGTSENFWSFDPKQRPGDTSAYGEGLMFFTNSEKLAKEYASLGTQAARKAGADVIKAEQEFDAVASNMFPGVSLDYLETNGFNVANEAIQFGEITKEQYDKFSDASFKLADAKKRQVDLSWPPAERRIVKAYLKIEKPVEKKIEGGPFYASWNLHLPEMFKEMKDSGGDGFIAEGVYDSPYGSEIKSTVYAVENPTQIKSADPITRDNSGNVIPLSQRFQQSSADIRYMPQPDPSVPGAYSVTGGFRILPGKTKGRLRVYGPAGSLVGIAGSLDEAQRMIRKKTKTN